MNSARSRNVTAAVALLPLVASWVWKEILNPRPFWVHYFDPEIAHFYEGLRILRGLPPLNIDNPATPVQLASALIALFTGTSPVTYPDFLRVAHTFGLLLSVGGLFLLVHTLLRDVPRPVALAALWTWFLAPQALEYQLVWCSEMFYFGLGALALAAIANALSNPATARRDALAGASIGLLVATKFVFLPWLGALWVGYLVARERFFVRSATATLGAAITFVLTTAVAWPRYPAMAAWLANLAMNSGTYGRGPREAPSLADAFTQYGQLAMTAKGWMLWLVLVVICAVVAFRRGSRPIIVFATTASVAALIFAMRAPTFRYLMPVVLCAVLVVATSRWQPVLLAVVSFLLVTRALVRDVTDHSNRIDSVSGVRARVERLLPPGVVVYSWRFSTPSFALRINSHTEEQRSEIARQYPMEGHYNDWTRRVMLPPGARGWDALVIDEALLPGFPQPVGRMVAKVENYRIILPPGR